MRQAAAEGHLDRIEELEQLAKQYCVFEELDEVLDLVSAGLGQALMVAGGDGARGPVAVFRLLYLVHTFNTPIRTPSLRSSCICVSAPGSAHAAEELHVTDLLSPDK